MPERRGGLQDRRCRSHAATSAMVGKSVVLLLLLLLFGRARTGQDRQDYRETAAETRRRTDDERHRQALH